VENYCVTVIKMAQERYFEDSVEIPEGTTIEIVNGLIKVTGSKGVVEKEIKNKMLHHEIKSNEIILFGDKSDLRRKKIVNTFLAHIKNMIKGANEGHIYKLKICSGHFPMTVAVKGNVLEIKNFIGEAKPRTLKLKEGVTVKVNGQEITVESINKEIAGQTSASIEKLTRRPGFDRRIFQDGIYITDKDGKKI